jgi:hypothetical protein
LFNDSVGTTDLWANADSYYPGTNWYSNNTPDTTTVGTTWHLGEGSGAGAKVITITVTTAATNSGCTFQGAAEVITAA